MRIKSSGNELKVNFIIIAVANLGSKAIAFILAPLYSYYLSVEQYGTMDLITTTANLMLPFICLDVYEATFRFASDHKYSESEKLSTSLFLCLPAIIIYIIICLLYSFSPNISKTILYTGAFVLLDAVNAVLAQHLRGSNRMVAYGMTGIINSVVLLISSVLFLVTLKRGLNGWCISFLLAKFANLVFAVFSIKLPRYLSHKSVNKSLMIEFLKYSVPLVPSATMWWIMNASDRYMLALFIGTAATGIYAVGNKIPSLLSILENIFYQAWQTSAINAFEKKERDRIYSVVFSNYFYVMTVGVAGVLLVAKLAITFLFAENYHSAWICMGPLTVGVMVHALAGNLGTLYTTFKKTKGALITTIAGAGCNILLNTFIIPVLGTLGAAITTLLGYTVTLFIRWFDVKKFASLTINKKKILLYSILILLQLLLYYIPGLLPYLFELIILTFLFYSERHLFIKMIKK